MGKPFQPPRTHPWDFIPRRGLFGGWWAEPGSVALVAGAPDTVSDWTERLSGAFRQVSQAAVGLQPDWRPDGSETYGIAGARADAIQTAGASEMLSTLAASAWDFINTECEVLCAVGGPGAGTFWSNTDFIAPDGVRAGKTGTRAFIEARGVWFLQTSVLNFAGGIPWVVDGIVNTAADLVIRITEKTASDEATRVGVVPNTPSGQTMSFFSNPGGGRDSYSHFAYLFWDRQLEDRERTRATQALLRWMEA